MQNDSRLQEHNFGYEIVINFKACGIDKYTKVQCEKRDPDDRALAAGLDDNLMPISIGSG